MKKLILSLIIISLSITILIENVSAYFPATYSNAIQKQFSEACLDNIYSKPFTESIWCRLFGINCKVISGCNLDKVRTCNYNYPKDYSCMPDIERECFRACLNKGLEYEELKQHLFEPSECICYDKLNLIILKR